MQCEKCGSTSHRENDCVFEKYAHLIKNSSRKSYIATETLLNQKVAKKKIKGFSARMIRKRMALLPVPKASLPPPPAPSINANVEDGIDLKDDEILGYARLHSILPSKNSSNPMDELRASVIRELDTVGGTLTGRFSGEKIRNASVALTCSSLSESDEEFVEHLEASGYIDSGNVGEILKYLNTRCKHPSCSGGWLVWRSFVENKKSAKPPPPV